MLSVYWSMSKINLGREKILRHILSGVWRRLWTGHISFRPNLRNLFIIVIIIYWINKWKISFLWIFGFTVSQQNRTNIPRIYRELLEYIYFWSRCLLYLYPPYCQRQTHFINKYNKYYHRSQIIIPLQSSNLMRKLM